MRSPDQIPMSTETTTSDAPAGRKRGSALIMTVGTLALIAVIAAFYVTLGQADSRMSRGVERGQNLVAVESQVASYFAQVIADDRVAVSTETITNDQNAVGPWVDRLGNEIQPTPASRQRFIREATDYPYTDFSVKSVIVQGLPDLSETDIAFQPQYYFNTPGVFGGSYLTIADAAERFRFRPAGDHPVMLDLPDTLGIPGTGDSISLGDGDFEALLDYRVASDPWLAPAEPTFTGLGDPDDNANTLPAERRIFSRAITQYADTPLIDSTPVSDFSAYAAFSAEYDYLDNRDWAQISNLAPDGLSVNLWNLRGHFNAQSGLGTDSGGRFRMSENRTLLTLHNIDDTPSPATGDIRSDNNVIAATDRLHFAADDASFPGLLQRNNPASFALRNTPAWWTMNQRFLYFPADPGFQILGRADTASDTIDSTGLVPQHWGTPDFPDYQYADADGDGFYDSRWFELKDSTLGQLGVRSLLENETDLRFVIAGRVIDLSGRVNVNSATDGLTPPTSDVPAGATPAEIDLRRLLTLQDAGEMFRPVFENTDNDNPTGNQKLSYAHIERLPFNDRQENNPGLVAADYERALVSRDMRVYENILPGGAFDDGRLSVLDGVGINTGRFAYDALRREIQADELYLPTTATNLRAPDDGGNPYADPLTLADGSTFEYFNYSPDVDDPSERLYPIRAQPFNGFPAIFANEFVPGEFSRDLRTLARWRRDSWFDIGGVNITNRGDTAETRDGLGSRLFGLDDLTELLYYNGKNDDSKLSRLERVTQGRFENGAPDVDMSTIALGPLRATRPTALERRGHDVKANHLNPNGGFSQATFTPDNQIDDEVFALDALNPRLRLTTISGAAPLRSRVVEDIDHDGVLSNEERRLTALDARLSLAPSPIVVNEFSTEGPSADVGGTQLSAGGNAFSRSDSSANASFLADGFEPGMRVSVTGFVNPENNGRFTITDVTDDRLTVAEPLEPEAQGLGREIAVLSDAERPDVLFQYYADALAPYASVDATWNTDPEAETGHISQTDFPRMRTLAYGYRGSELALRLSAHLSVNMADMYDADDEPSPYTVLALKSIDARRTLNEDQLSQGLVAPYPWWADNKRLDLGDENLAPTKEDLTDPALGVSEDWSRVAYNVYGVEAQPVITEVSVVTIFSDVPQSRLMTQFGQNAAGFEGCVMGGDSTFSTSDPSTGPDWESVGEHPGHSEKLFQEGQGSGGDQGADDGDQDDITMRVDISPENPDLVAHVLAIQLTNPFDVPINLSGDDTTPNGGTVDGGALNSDNNTQLESVKYYIEYNGHFFPLAQFFERAGNVNPATVDPVTNAGSAYQPIPTFPEEQNRTETRKLYAVTLEPGESRVFYVSAHPSVHDMNRRWRAIDATYPVGLSTNGLQSGMEITDRDSRLLFEEFIDTQFTVTDEDGVPLHQRLLSTNSTEYLDPDNHPAGGPAPTSTHRIDPRRPVRLIPFNPETGRLGNSGTPYNGNPSGGHFVDFQRTSRAFRFRLGDPLPTNFDAFHRMRQEVRLWRRMTVSDDAPFGGDTEAETFDGTTVRNRIENDLLVDRLRDPMLPTENTSGQELATLDLAAFDTNRVNAMNTDAAGDLDPFTQMLTSFGQIHPDWLATSAGLEPTSNPKAKQIYIRNTTVAPESNPFSWWSNTSQGMTVVRFAGYRRPDHMEENTDDDSARAVALRGLLPAWAVESREMNYNTAVPAVLGEIDFDQNNDGILDGTQNITQGQVSPATAAVKAMADVIQDAVTDARIDLDFGENQGLGGGYVIGFRSNNGATNFSSDLPTTDVVRSMRYLLTGGVGPSFNVRGGVIPILEQNTEWATPPIATEEYQLDTDAAIVPSIRRHPDHKIVISFTDQRQNDFREAISKLAQNSAGSPIDISNFPQAADYDGYTPTLLNTQEIKGLNPNNVPATMNANQSLLFNNSDRFGFEGDEIRTTTVRLGDLLLPLAVGPTFAPRLSAPLDIIGTPFVEGEPWAWDNINGARNFRPGDWTTLPEALAAALGLEPPAFYNKDPDSAGYSLLCELVERSGEAGTPANWDGVGGPRPLTHQSLAPAGTTVDFANGLGSHIEFVLDKGRLHIDQYTPFYNGDSRYNIVDSESFFNQDRPETVSVSFNPVDPNNVRNDAVDYRVGFSVPPAQRLLSMGQALTRGGDPLTTPVIGTININTASDTVLRTIPGFAMSMQYSSAKIDYDHYEPPVTDNDLISSTPSVGLGESDRLMEWWPGRIAGRTLRNPLPYTPGLNSPSRIYPIPFGPVHEPEQGQPYEPRKSGLGDPLELRGPFLGDGWRLTSEISPFLKSFRDRSHASFRLAAKDVPPPGAGIPPLGTVFIEPDEALDLTPYFRDSAPPGYPGFLPYRSLPELAFGIDAFDTNSSTSVERFRDTVATNYARDYARSSLNGQIGAIERPGMDGVGTILGLSLQRREPLTRPADTETINLRLYSSGGDGATPPDDVRWPDHVHRKNPQSTITQLGTDLHRYDIIGPYGDPENRRVLASLDQDNNQSSDPDGDGTNEYNPTHPFQDGYDPVIDPLEDDNFSYTLGRAFFGNDNSDPTRRPNVLEDELANDLLEELALFNGSANTIDTRSDFYAAWFVLRGYAESDVMGLDGTAPMTPSYQKRFLMVIDRSNVTDLGQTPRILLFKEIPL